MTDTHPQVGYNGQRGLPDQSAPSRPGRSSSAAEVVLARQAARDLGIAAHLAGENAFTYGLLYGREDRQAEQLQARARQVWKRASRRRYRKWMK